MSDTINLNGRSVTTLADKATINADTMNLGSETTTKQITIGTPAAHVDVRGSVIDFHNTPVSNFPFPSGTTTTLATHVGVSLVSQGVGPNLVLNGLIAGSSNISIVGGSERVTLDVASPPTLSGAGGDVSLVYNGTSPNLQTKGLIAGSGVELGDNGSAVIITNSQPGTAYTLSQSGTGNGMLNSGTNPSGPMWTIRGLVAGTNINITDVSGSALQIDSTASGTTSTLTDQTTASASIIYNGGSNPLVLRPFANTTSVTWDSTSNPNVVQATINIQTTSTGNTGLLYDGQTLKQIAGGSNIQVVDNGSYITINYVP